MFYEVLQIANTIYLQVHVHLLDARLVTLAHSLSKSISYFSSSKCKNSTSRYENWASRSGDSNAKLELVNVKLAKVEVEINLC